MAAGNRQDGEDAARVIMVAAAIDMAARRVPWVHQGRNSRSGVDCIGVPIEAARAAGLNPPQRANYRRQADVGAFLEAMHAACEPLLDGQVRPADVIEFRIKLRDMDARSVQPHLGLWIGGGQMVHACQTTGVVVRCDLDERWKRRVMGWWRLREFC